MAFYEAPRPAPFGAISIYRIASAVEAPIRAFKRWSIARRTETELSKLTNRELMDIGLERGWLADVSDDAARRF